MAMDVFDFQLHLEALETKPLLVLRLKAILSPFKLSKNPADS
jgi:hypothetical protein